VPRRGGAAALRELLDAAHDRGMRVVLDGVFNHTGRGFWPFHHVLETGADSPYRGWFHLDEAALAAGRPLLAYPPPGTPASALGYVAWDGLPALPKLDTDEPAVREYLFRVAEHWLRFGIDGWRLDVPAQIDDEAFWQEFRTRCRAIRSDAYLVGEIWRIAPDWLRGDRFDALMNYPLAEAILAFSGGPSLDMEVVRNHHEYGLVMRPLDAPGFAARLIETLEAYDPDVVAVQFNLLGSHDAPRMRTVLGDDDGAVRLATILQMTLPGAPCIYYGDEIGMAGGNDPSCRAAFPWDETRWDTGTLAFVREIVSLRRDEPALRHGSVAILAAVDGAVAYERRLGERTILVAVNAGPTATTLQVRPAASGGERPIRLLGHGDCEVAPMTEDGLRIAIPGRAGVILGLGRR
jgi:neopullulanase